MSRYQSVHIPEQQVELLQKGDRHALALVYQSLSGVVYGMALRILCDPHAASEVTQDTFLNIMEKVGQLKQRSAFIGWVRSIAVNHCMMRIRVSSRQDPEGETKLLEEVDHRGDPEFLSDIERALQSLAPDTRLVIWMHEVEGFTHHEIARIFGRSKSFSKSRLARGRAQLKERYRSETNAEETLFRPKQNNGTA